MMRKNATENALGNFRFRGGPSELAQRVLIIPDRFQSARTATRTAVAIARGGDGCEAKDKAETAAPE